MKNTPFILLFVALFVQISLTAGGLEKGFESLDKKDYYGAKKQFEKVLFKEPIGANFGLSRVHFERKNPFYDIRKSLRYANSADSAFYNGLERDREGLAALGVTEKSIKELKEAIGNRAYEDLLDAPTDSSIQVFVKDFRFSNRFPEVIAIRDQRAFELALDQDTYESYRQFIIDYPGAKQREQADSLYARKFFEVKTSNGSVEGYRQFVKEFPANPYTNQAYDTIFKSVVRLNTSKAYRDYILEFPENQNTLVAWRAFNILLLKNYDEATLKGIVESFPRNPYRSQLEVELKYYKSKRLVLKTPEGEQLIGIDGNSIGDVYESIDVFSEGLSKVLKDGKVGFIDKSGKVIIPLEYQDAYIFQGGLSVVESDDKFGAIDRFGNVVVPLIYDGLGNLSSGYFAFEKGEESGFIDWMGKLSFGRTFEFSSDFKNGKAIVRVDGKYGAIDTTGSYTIPALYDWVEESVNDYSRVRKDSLFGLYKHGLKLVYPIEYSAIGELGSGLRMVVKNDQFGYANEQGDIAIPIQFNFLKSFQKQFKFQNSQAAVISEDKWGLIDISGEYLLEPKYEQLVNSGYSILEYLKQDKWGHISSNGDVFPGLYDELTSYKQGLSRCVKDGQVGLLDAGGRLVVEMRYKDLKPIQDSELIIFETENGSGIMNRDDIVILADEYDKIEVINLRFAKLLKEGQEVLYDMTDEKIVVGLSNE